MWMVRANSFANYPQKITNFAYFLPDNSPICPWPEYETEISESVPIGTYVLSVEAHDPDLGKFQLLNQFQDRYSN